MTTKTKKNGKTQTLTVQFKVEDLDLALRDVFDLFEGFGGVKCLLLGKTAESAVKGSLEGDKVQVGIRKLELTEARRSSAYAHIADYFRRGYSKTMVFEPDSPPVGELLISYDFHGVPIEIKVISRKYAFFEHPDAIFYNFDDYIIPNPLGRYLKAQYIVR